MDNELVDADEVLIEFYLLRGKMKIINEVHTENMAFCRKCAKLLRSRIDSIAEQIQANKKLLSQIERDLSHSGTAKPSIHEFQSKINLKDLPSSTQVPEYGIIVVEAEKENLDDAMYGEDTHVDTDSVCDPYYDQKLVTRKPKGKFARLCKCLSHPFQKLINKFTNASRNRQFT